MRAHLVQLDIVWEEKEKNRERAASLVAGAGPLRGDLVVVPEMFDTGFSFNVARTADGDGATLAFLGALARTHGVYVHGARTLTDEAGRGRNMATIVGPEGNVIVEYEKVHPFSFGTPGRRESDHFPGGAEVVTYAWGEGERAVRVCPAICYDLRFPELFRRGLLAGAEMFVVPANWPEGRAMHFRALLVARAIENQGYVLGVNRTGRDPALAYAGGTIAIDPKGEVVGELGAEEGVLSVEVKAGRVKEWRARFPAWRDHRLLSGAGE